VIEASPESIDTPGTPRAADPVPKNISKTEKENRLDCERRQFHNVNMPQIKLEDASQVPARNELMQCLMSKRHSRTNSDISLQKESIRESGIDKSHTDKSHREKSMTDMSRLDKSRTDNKNPSRNGQVTQDRETFGAEMKDIYNRKQITPLRGAYFEL